MEKDIKPKTGLCYSQVAYIGTFYAKFHWNRFGTFCVIGPQTNKYEPPLLLNNLDVLKSSHRFKDLFTIRSNLAYNRHWHLVGKYHFKWFVEVRFRSFWKPGVGSVNAKAWRHSLQARQQQTRNASSCRQVNENEKGIFFPTYLFCLTFPFLHS